MFRWFANTALFTAFLLTSALPIQASGGSGRIPKEVSSEGAGPSSAQPSTSSAAAAEDERAAGHAQDSLAPTHDEAMRCFDAWNRRQSSQEDAALLSRMLQIARSGEPIDRMGVIHRLWDYKDAQQQYIYRAEFAPMLLGIARDPNNRNRIDAIHYLWSEYAHQEPYRTQLPSLLLDIVRNSTNLLARDQAVLYSFHLWRSKDPHLERDRTELTLLLRDIARNPAEPFRMGAIVNLFTSNDAQQETYRAELLPIVFDIVRTPEYPKRLDMIRFLWDLKCDQQEDYQRQLFPLVLALSHDSSIRGRAVDFLAKQPQDPATDVLIKKLENNRHGLLRHLAFNDVEPKILSDIIDRLYPAFVANKGVISYLSPEMHHVLTLKGLTKEQELLSERMADLFSHPPNGAPVAPEAAVAVAVASEHPLALLLFSSVVLEETMLRRRIEAAQLDEALISLLKTGHLL